MRGQQYSLKKSSFHENWSGYSITVCDQEVNAPAEQPYTHTISAAARLEGLAGNVLAAPANPPQQNM
jgi:hypothetical protein